MSLEKMRRKLDEVDSSLVENISKRFKIVVEIAEYKKKNNMAVKDENREEEIMKRLKEKAQKNKIDFKIIKKVFEILIKESRELQNKIINKKYEQ